MKKTFFGKIPRQTKNFLMFLLRICNLIIMKPEHSVLPILNSICAREISRSELNYIIELSQKFAQSYLKYRYRNFSKVLLSADLSIIELSIDAIAPLFERNEDGIFIKIKTAFKNWNPPIDSEEKALFFLNRLIGKSVEKYVSELLRQSDPFFSKIRDSVDYIILKQGYKKERIVGIVYIVEANYVKTVGSLPDTNLVFDLPVELFSVKNNILPRIFNYIKNETDKTPAIPLNALIMKIKQIWATENKFLEDRPDGYKIEIDSILDKACLVTINKLEESYLSIGKISQYEADAMKNALHNIIYDLRDGGVIPGLHKYLIEQMPELSFENYKRKYQNTFEYLFKLLKKEISNNLVD